MTAKEMPAERPAVLIRTFPPSTNANYGGVLQAWALQRALSDVGFDAVADSTRRLRWSTFSRRWLKHVALDHLLHFCGGRAIGALLPKGLQERAVESVRGDSITDFSRSRIPMIGLLDPWGRVKEKIASRFEAFVVGSDQVWRPSSLTDMRSNFHGYLGAGDTRVRFSYAASFGTENPAFPRDTLPEIRSLARQLDGVSVREMSAVEVCRDVLDIDAIVHVDPTLLVDAQVYRELAAHAAETAGGRVASYVLDRSEPKSRTLSSVRAELGDSWVDLVRPARVGVAEYRRNRMMYRPFSVEQWLRCMSSSDFVVTDSFHGTVFALIFNKPFVAIANRDRGTARFESLLDLFGLQERLVEPGSTVPPHLLVDSVDWDAVNARIASERERSRAYMHSMLELTRRRTTDRVGNAVIAESSW